MDPQKLSSLDPKLRDAYQRVMGTVIPKPQSPPEVQTTPPSASEPSIPEPTTTPPQSKSESTPTPTPTPEPIPTPNIEPVAEPQTPPAVKPEPFFKEPPVSEPVAAEPQPTIPQPETAPIPQPANPTQPTSNFTQMNSEVSAAPTPTQNFTAPVLQTQTAVLKKKGNILMPIMIAITMLVFVVVYALFWARIFNFKLPFLP